MKNSESTKMVGEEVVKHSNNIKGLPECAGENCSLKPNGNFERSPHQWQPIADAGGWLAPADKEIWTKIDDDHGERNVRKLTRYGSLWWTNPDRSKGMYVYYTPTHWNPSS